MRHSFSTHARYLSGEKALLANFPSNQGILGATSIQATPLTLGPKRADGRFNLKISGQPLFPFCSLDKNFSLIYLRLSSISFLAIFFVPLHFTPSPTLDHPACLGNGSIDVVFLPCLSDPPFSHNPPDFPDSNGPSVCGEVACRYLSTPIYRILELLRPTAHNRFTLLSY